MGAHIFAVARPQSALQKREDLLSWQNLGLPDHERRPLRPLCCVRLMNGASCPEESSILFGELGFCHLHRPAESVE